MSTAWHDEEARSLLSDLPPEKDPALLHLLTCPACREWATHRLLQDLGIGEVLPGYDGMWNRLEGRLPWMVEEAERRNLIAEALLVELLGAPQGERERTLQDPRFHSLDLLELLLEASQEAQPEDCERSEALAALAAQLTGRLRNEMGETISALYLTRAAILRGNALRMRGNLVPAEDALGRAAHFLCWPFESWDRAAYCRALGLLRWEQGRLDEAAALFRYAARSFAEDHLPREEGACLALAGLLHLEQRQMKAAVRCLQTGRATLDPEARPWLTVRAGLSLALVLADLGQVDRAQAVLKETWTHYSRVRDEREHVRICWLEGKICARIGRREEAEHILSAVRRKLISEYSLPEAMLCSLDLAVLLVEAGRGAEVPQLLPDIEETFAAESAGLDAARRVYGSFLSSSESAQTMSREAAASWESSLRRVFRFRGYRVEPLPFA